MLDPAQGRGWPRGVGSRRIRRSGGGRRHHRRRLGRDAVPIDAVWGGRRGAAGGGGMEVEMGSKRQGRAGRWVSFLLFSPLYLNMVQG